MLSKRRADGADGRGRFRIAWTTAIKCSAAALLLMGACLPWVVYGSHRSLASMHNAPVMWLSPDYLPRRQFLEFIRDFQTNDSVIISWPGCSVDDPRLEQLALELTGDGVRNGFPYSDLFADVLSGYTALRQLMAEPLELSRRRASRRLQGALIGPDGRSSCAIVALTQYGAEQRKATLDVLLDTATETIGVPRDELRLAGAVVDGVAIDVESESSSALPLISAVVALLMCQLCLRSWLMTLPVLATAAFSEGLVLAALHYSGITLNAVLLVMAPLVFVLTVSAGVHLVNYYCDEARRDGPVGATRRALLVGWAPCTLAAVTTAIGLGSLLVSEIVPIRDFGVFGAVGVLSATVLLFLIAPGFFDYCTRIWEQRTPRFATGRTWVRVPWSLVSGFIGRRSMYVVLTALSIMALCGWGLTRVHTSVNIRDLLNGENSAIRDRGWLESRLGPLVPIEILVHFNNSSQLDIVQRADLVGRIHVQITRLDGIEGAISGVTFMPPIPDPRGIRGVIRRTVLRKRLSSRKQLLMDGHWLHESPDRQSWRIATRVAGSADTDYGEVIRRLEEQVRPILGENNSETEITITGVTPLVYGAQRALLKDLFTSFLTALLLVTAVMMVVQRSLLAGLVTMLPNAFPALLLFGLMGWLKVNVDIGSMMTASVALGIAVDGTLHFLTWYRRSTRKGYPPLKAVELAYRHCGLAMLQTTLICSLGLLVFTSSGFLPAQRFAWMMMTLLFAALAGDLILLPALLVGPTGRLLAQRDGRRGEMNEEGLDEPRTDVGYSNAAQAEGDLDLAEADRHLGSNDSRSP